MTNLTQDEQKLYASIRELIEETRSNVSKAVNIGLTLMFWNIGKVINENILEHKRAAYGETTINSVSKLLTAEYGKGYSKSALVRMCKFQKEFPDIQIVATLSQQLSWSHFVEIIPLKTDLERVFYAQMCHLERWTVRVLRDKIRSMLFERTAISQKPEELARAELSALREQGQMSPDLVFRNPYILNFLGLKGKFLEKDLEEAILNKLELFLLELGNGFTFVERQKRMIIDGKDYKLDLLFFHRKLKRLIAIDLKIGKFEAAYKGQMELYLRWLEKYEMEKNEKPPIGMILCAEGNHEQIELLQLDKTNVKVAQYITEYLPQDLLKRKLHQFVTTSKQQIDSK
ncbi:MAG: PDDEXK nuclease domain-containing protein [Bacteroidota bacterium]